MTTKSFFVLSTGESAATATPVLATSDAGGVRGIAPRVHQVVGRCVPT